MHKVMHIRSSFDPGGTETLLLNTFNETQENFRMYLVLLRPGTLIGRLDHTSNNRFFQWFRKGFLDFHILQKMNALIKQEKIQIIHTHQFIELTYAILLKIVNPKVKIVHQVHLLFQSKDLAFYLERRLSHLVSKILTVSKTAQNTLIRDFGFPERNLGVLYNGVKSTGQLKENNGIPKIPAEPSKFNIVMVANFVFGKDHETILRAYNRHIRNKMPDTNLYFIGRESDISERLKTRYLNHYDLDNKRVVFCGIIPDAQSILHRFDLVVMSCVSETFNIALAEAVFAEKQVLASDIQVFKEISDEGKYFHLFKTSDPDDFFQQLLKIRQIAPNTYRKNQIQSFKEKFSFDSYMNNLSKVYEELEKI